MNMKNNESKLLREYVKTLLNEDDGYGGLYGVAAEMSPFGMHYASQDQMYNTFIKPFVDVVEVTAGKTKEMSERTLTAIRVAFEAAASSLIPALSSDYSEIFEAERQQLEKIKSEYSEVYNASWDALKQHDIVWSAFLGWPAMFLTAKAAEKAPAAVAHVLSVLSGGSLDGFLSKVKGKYHLGSAKSSSGSSHGGGDKIGSYFESVIKEENEDKKSTTVGDVLSNKKVVSRALGSPYAQRMQSDGQKIVKGTLNKIAEKASAVARATSLQDMQKITGKPIKGMDAIAKADPQQRKAAEANLLTLVKKSAKEMYVKELEAQIKEAVSAGVPRESEFVKMYLTTISKIKSL